MAHSWHGREDCPTQHVINEQLPYVAFSYLSFLTYNHVLPKFTFLALAAFV